MAGAQFSMDMSGLNTGIAEGLNHFINNRRLAAEIGEAMVSSTRQRFRDEETPDGDKWEESGRARAEGGQTLTDNAILKNSIGYEATGDTVAWGTAEVYGGIHQMGGRTGRNHAVNMPARPYLGLSDDDREEIQGILVDFVAEGFEP